MTSSTLCSRHLYRSLLQWYRKTLLMEQSTVWRCPPTGRAWSTRRGTLQYITLLCIEEESEIRCPFCTFVALLQTVPQQKTCTNIGRMLRIPTSLISKDTLRCESIAAPQCSAKTTHLRNECRLITRVCSQCIVTHVVRTQRHSFQNSYIVIMGVGDGLTALRAALALSSSLPIWWRHRNMCQCIGPNSYYISTIGSITLTTL